MRRSARNIVATLGLLALSGCNAVVFNPSGDIAIRQRDEIIIATVLMLIIILPVMGLTIYFAWRYRESNKDADYDPDWHHSTSLELVIWAAPLLIIIFLGAVTWTGTHLLDPYRPLDRIDAARPGPPSEAPIDVQVVALDWKWLFIYPQYGVASLNEMAAPVDRPIRFSITAQNVMNSFFVPAIAGQIYAMPGMQTTLYAVANKRGDYQGFSANLSGLGFSGMTFTFHATSPADFDKWIAKARAGKTHLTRAEYLKLEAPSEAVPVTYFGAAEDGLFTAVVNRCVRPGQTCIRTMMTRHGTGDGATQKTKQETGTGN